MGLIYIGSGTANGWVFPQMHKFSPCKDFPYVTGFAKTQNNLATTEIQIMA